MFSVTRQLHLLLPVAALLVLPGCMSGAPVAAPGHGMRAIQISADQQDHMWERVVSVLHKYHFTIARESRIEGLIETNYRAGSNLLEPWHHDSVGYANRLESTVQSIRRRVIVRFQSSTPGAVTVSIQVEKQIEDVPGLAANYEGGATFPEAAPLDRNLDQVVGQVGVSRWLPRGDDPALAAEIIRDIQFGGRH